MSVKSDLVWGNVKFKKVFCSTISIFYLCNEVGYRGGVMKERATLFVLLVVVALLVVTIVQGTGVGV